MAWRTTGTLRTLLALLCGAGAAACSPPAPEVALLARTKYGGTLRWTNGQVLLRPVSPLPRARVALAEFEQALQRAANTWNRALAGCGAPQLQVARMTRRALPVRQDGHSAVVLRGTWCPDGAVDEADCYARHREAITHLYPHQLPQDPRDGDIAEADIEVNAQHQTWSLQGSQPGTRSLEAVLAHELGHVLGLDHPCVRDGPRTSRFGERRLSCANPAARRLLMYPSLAPNAQAPITKPAPAEVKAVCAQYAEP